MGVEATAPSPPRPAAPSALQPAGGPGQPPLGLWRAGLGALIAADQIAPWRPREWAGPPWRREGPAVLPVELAPRGPACPRPRHSCDPVSWRGGVDGIAIPGMGRRVAAVGTEPADDEVGALRGSAPGRSATFGWSATDSLGLPDSPNE